MVVSFLSGYWQKDGVMVLSLPKIAKRYLCTWFILDLVIVGADWVTVLTSAGIDGFGLLRGARVLRILRSLRLLRLAKLKHIVNEIRDRSESVVFDAILELTKSITIILFLNHILSCVWYAVGHQAIESVDSDYLSPEAALAHKHPGDWKTTWLLVLVEDNDIDLYSPGYRYLTSLHWSLTQFTPATMDVFATNHPERLLNVIALIISLVVFGSFLSSLTACVTKLRGLKADHERQMSNLRRYLNERSLPEQLKQRIKKFVEYRAAREQKFLKDG